MAEHGGTLDTGSGHLAHLEHRPGEYRVKLYIEIAIILTIITAVEVAVWYIHWLHEVHALGPILIVMSAIKFSLVVSVYMHLKFDDKRFSWMFLFGLGVAISIVLALYFLFKYHEMVVHLYL